MGKYTLGYLYELEEKVNVLKFKQMKNISEIKELEKLKEELEVVRRQIMWDIENGTLDYEDNVPKSKKK